MTIDERLDRLTERHEALTQSVELLLVDNRQIAEENKQRDRRMGEIMESIAQDGEHIRALARIAEIHNARLERLEGGPRG